MWTDVDSSAAVKLVVEEPESRALRDWLDDRDVTSSRLTHTEATRAIRRVSEHPSDVDRLHDELSRWVLISIDELLLARAGTIEPRSLCSLDAIHLATAQWFAPELEAFVTYDARLADAAKLLGLRVVMPGV